MGVDILIINGPNLKYLGEREPHIYGTDSLEKLPSLIESWIPSGIKDSLNLQYFQSNLEGELINRLEDAWKARIDGIVINAGAYTHTSLALHDCISWIGIPTVEVHLSNLWARDEKIRHTSMLSPRCIGVISGFGLFGYVLAILALLKHLTSSSS